MDPEITQNPNPEDNPPELTQNDPAPEPEKIRDGTDLNTDSLIAENQRLALELECADLGVPKFARNDVIKLAQGSSVGDVLKKYPAFLCGNNAASTGVFLRRERSDDDLSLRKAFGLD